MAKRKVAKKKTVKAKAKRVQPLRSTEKQLNESLKSSNYFTKHAIGKDAYSVYKKIVSKAKRGMDSKKLHSTRGKYTKQRTAIHNQIMRKFLRQDTRTKSPDVYVFGGVGGSGKSSVLAKLVKEKAMTINNDDIKKELAKYDPSPIKRFPLLHATFLHEESSDIEKKLLAKAIQSKKDIILDRTLASFAKQKKILQGIKDNGYKITVLGTNLPPHIAMIRVASRSVNKGRFVPYDVIKKKGNKTNASVLKMAKQKFVSKARVYDTRKRKAKLMFRKG